MGRSHADVIDRFKADRGNRTYGGDCEWYGANVLCYGDRLYSYGSHHVLAMRLEDGTFLKNGDRPSSSTSGHLADVQKTIPGPTISFSSLSRGPRGVKHPNDIRSKDILDARADMTEQIIRVPNEGYVKGHTNWDPETKEYKRWTEQFSAPNVGMFIEDTYQHVNDRLNLPDDAVSGVWHVLGAVLLRLKDRDTGKYRRFLCTMDEGTYCVIECPGSPSTVDDAFDVLKPETINGDAFERQGEWFFTDTDLDDAAFAASIGSSKTRFLETTEIRPLFTPDDPRETSLSNKHTARQYESPNATYVRGKVIHRDQFGDRSGEHTTLNLATWHVVHRAREIASWSVQGRVD